MRPVLPLLLVVLTHAPVAADAPLDSQSRRRLLAESARNLEADLTTSRLAALPATRRLLLETLRTPAVDFLWDDSLPRPAKAYAAWIGWQVEETPPAAWRTRTQRQPPADALDQMIGLLPHWVEQASRGKKKNAGNICGTYGKAFSVLYPLMAVDRKLLDGLLQAVGDRPGKRVNRRLSALLARLTPEAAMEAAKRYRKLPPTLRLAIYLAVSELVPEHPDRRRAYGHLMWHISRYGPPDIRYQAGLRVRRLLSQQEERALHGAWFRSHFTKEDIKRVLANRGVGVRGTARRQQERTEGKQATTAKSEVPQGDATPSPRDDARSRTARPSPEKAPSDEADAPARSWLFLLAAAIVALGGILAAHRLRG